MIRRLLSSVALLAMVALPPLLLNRWGFSDWGAIHLWSATDVRVLLGALTLAGWLAWSVWMVAFLAEAVVALSGRRLSLRLPGLDVPRALASTLLAMALTAGAASVSHAGEPRPGVPPVSARAADRPDTRSAEAAPLAEAAPAPATPGHRHTVRPGDDLWSLAQRYYGDGAAWRTIVAANPALQEDPLARLTPGAVLTVQDPVHLVTVRAGDTLSGLAAQHLGDPERWPEIHRLNAQRVHDPDLIRPGWVLRVPLELEAAAPEALPAPQPDLVPQPDLAPQPDPAPAPPADDAPPSTTASSADPENRPGATPAVERLAPDEDPSVAGRLLGGMTALSAAAVLGGVGLRRRVQAQARPLGRRFAQPAGELSRYEAALTQVAAAGPVPDRPALLCRAMRLLARHWWQQDEAAPPLDHVLLGPEGLRFQVGGASSSIPPGFAELDGGLVMSWTALASLDDVEHPVAYPALVTLGEAEPGSYVMVDLARSGVLGVTDDGRKGAGEVISAMLVELACSPWADELELLVVTDDPGFVRAASEGAVVCSDVESAVATVERLVRERSRFMGGAGWDAGRLHPDLAEAWAAQVVLFEAAPSADQLARLEAALAVVPCGVAAVAVVDAAQASSVDWVLSTDAAGARRVTDGGVRATPQTVPAETRAALAGLYDLANATTATPAPWWRAPSEDDVNIIALRAAPAPAPRPGPRLNLLGPVELLGCSGEPPQRALRQCLEYCAWLLLHPGSTPVQMANALVVAEGTRRSNMSRLRTWLGRAPDGGLYLPDAYSGRIALHEDVTSDWEELALLTEGGLGRLSLETLVAALDLVRGAPLADAAPGQWGWAEEFRTDAAALVRDIGVVAARLARERGDLDTSRWAANRALAAAPDDELLLGERIRTEHAAGRGDEARRLVQRVTRTARILGVDLLPETVDLCQEVVEGRLRARA